MTSIRGTAIVTAIAASLAPASAFSAAIEEVIVTAQKREESLQKAPIAITAFTSETLADIGAYGLRGIGEFAPNVRVLSTAGSSVTATATIRGLSSAEPAFAQDPKVGFYLDGVYLSKNSGTIFDIVDLERIEVLRGPQGTLYGKNTTGGAINLISKKPSGELHFKQLLTAGNYGLFRSSSTLDLPAYNDVSVKLGYMTTQHDGYVKNENPRATEDLDSADNSAWRVAVRWEPNQDFTGDISYQFIDAESVTYHGQLTYVDPAVADLPVIASFSPFVLIPPSQNPFRQALDSGAVSKDRLDKLNLDGQGVERYDITDIAMHLSWQIGGIELRSITGYHELDGSALGGDQDGGSWSIPFAHFGTFAVGGDKKYHESFSQEFQLLGDALEDRLHYVAGLYYFDENAKEENNRWNLLIALPGGVISGFDSGVLVEQNALLGPPPGGLGEEYTIDNQSWAAYGQVTYTPEAFDERLSVTLGGRYTDDTKEAAIIDASPHWVEKQDWSNFNPTLTVEYAFSEDVNGYVKVASGYNAGSHPVRAGNPTAFALTADEENLVDYELGLKSMLFDQRLRLNVAAFWYDYKDLQVNDFQAGATVLRNAGQATLRGVEIEALARPTDNLELTLGYGYLDFEYEEFVVGGVDISDSAKAPFAPENTVQASAAYTWPLEKSCGEVQARLDLSYTDEYTFNPTLFLHDAADDRTLLNARLSWKEIPLPQGSLEVSAWVQNLTDEEYREFGTDFGALGFSTNSFGDPRTWGVDLRYEF
jgi:iron complex outermembrane recepter protein